MHRPYFHVCFTEVGLSENLIFINRCPTYYKNCIITSARDIFTELIEELSAEDFKGGRDGYTVSYHDTREFEFLLKLDESLVNIQSLKEFTFLERSSRFLELFLKANAHFV